MDDKCPIFKAMKSGFCLNEDCRHFNRGKNKSECQYSEMTKKRKMKNEAARKQREMYKGK